MAVVMLMANVTLKAYMKRKKNYMGNYQSKNPFSRAYSPAWKNHHNFRWSVN